MKKVIELKGVTMQFGGVTALNDVNLNVNEGEILALIGPNGAGKTTVFNVITGVYKPTKGDIVFNEELSVVGKKRWQITEAGIARTFQNVRLFGEMTALENVITAGDVRSKSGFVGSLLAFHVHAGKRRPTVRRLWSCLSSLALITWHISWARTCHTEINVALR